MKPSIHPEVYKDAKVTCTACKAVFLIPGTVKDMQIEICSQCHPVYTGKFRGLASSGRVEKFQKKLAAAKKEKTEKKPKKRKLTDKEKFEQKLRETKEREQEKKVQKEKVKKEKAIKDAKKTIKKAGNDTKVAKIAKAKKK